MAREDLPGHPGPGTGAGVARLEGTGALTLAQLAEYLAHTHVTVKPVIDLDHPDHPVDGYEVPTRLREQLRLRTPAIVFPWSSSPSRSADLYHTVPYLPTERGGPPG